MNDVIRVVGRHAQSPLIRFLSQGSNVQNIQGEMVTIDHVMGVMSALATECGVRLKHFQVMADLEGRRYVLHVEPTEELPRPVLERLLTSFDRELGKLNENYGMFRTDGLIAPPLLRVMRGGWFDRIFQDHLARSGRDSQFKPAILVGEAEHPEMAELSIASGEDVGQKPAERRGAR